LLELKNDPKMGGSWISIPLGAACPVDTCKNILAFIGSLCKRDPNKKDGPKAIFFFFPGSTGTLT
jgi:hypothetical protein